MDNSEVSVNSLGQKTLAELNSLRNLPAIPKIMFEVSELLRKKSQDTVALAEVIGKDQGLTTKVLKIANSPLYGLPRKVSSLEFAIMLLGMEEISNIVTALSLAEAMRADGIEHFDYLEFWAHSMLVGTASKDIAKRLGFFEIAGDAFVAGMLHDIGIQLTARYFSKQFQEIIDLSASEDVNYFDAEKTVLGVTHQEIGRFIMQRWNLPSTLSDALAFHHNPSEGKETLILTYIIHLADSMTQEFEVGNTFWDKGIDFDAENIGKILNFENTEQLSEFISDYKEMFIDTAESIKL